MRKKQMSFFFILLFAGGTVLAQDAVGFANLKRYALENERLIKSKKQVDVVFIGNSITEGWTRHDSAFFAAHHYVGRGISGQTSSQMLLRFQCDVVALKPKIVVINGGTNDIAGNTGSYNQDFTFNNIRSMADIAKNNGIQVILTSVLPAAAFPWRPEIKDATAKVDQLNTILKNYALKHGYTYVDYNIAMRDAKGGMKAQLASDGIHPNTEGYQIMEAIAEQAIGKCLKQK